MLILCVLAISLIVDLTVACSREQSRSETESVPARVRICDVIQNPACYETGVSPSEHALRRIAITDAIASITRLAITAVYQRTPIP